MADSFSNPRFFAPLARPRGEPQDRTVVAAIGLGIAAACLGLLGCADDFGIDAPAVFQPDPVVRTSTLVADADKTWESIGLSIRGKPIQATTIGSGPKRLYIVGGIHGDEPEGPEVAAALPAAFGEMPGLGEWTIRVVRDMNPDGSGAGKKTNTRGVDLNRNWPSKDFKPTPPYSKRPASELETIALKKDLERFKPDIVMVFHASHLGPFFHGAGKDPKLAVKLAGGARLIDANWTTRQQLRYDTPGSLSTFLAEQKSLTAITVEFGRMKDASTNAAAIRAALLVGLGKPGESDATVVNETVTQEAGAKASPSSKPTAAKQPTKPPASSSPKRVVDAR